ncbi:MAG: hypothetical protein JW772_02335 [Candidatus Diapherotrites archaeon]|nr:hypothetical protein [Candidatus Diapherotrites archaeon]
MRYNKKALDGAVAYYKKELSNELGKKSAVLIELQLKNSRAFFSLAPLSRAIHELGADANVFVLDGKSEMLGTLRRTWALFQKREQGADTKTLGAFIGSVQKKTKSKQFAKIFEAPNLELTASPKGFKGKGILLQYQTKWFKKFMWSQLNQTAKRILTQGYGIKKSERMSIGFELLPKKKDLELPLQDYLDSFSIAYSFALQAKRMCKKVAMGADTARMSQLEAMDRISDLSATISGCEYEKKISEPWFEEFKKLSPIIGAGKLKLSDASFAVHGKGYGGKHFFGLRIGYPTPNKKSRWQSPGQMFLKPWWLDQTKIDSRPAKRRHAITETLPIENYVRTCNIDYYEMRKRDDEIRNILKKCKKLYVKGKKVKGGQTNLVLDMTHILEKKSPVLASDIEVNPSTPGEASSIFKVKAGRYGNFPGGEVFLTPHKMDGVFVGDVVIAIDQSYIIGHNNPLVVRVKNGHYKIVSGPKKILNAFNKRKKEARNIISQLERHKSVPAKIIQTYKRNFDRVGEFAVNTNPKARLSRYLIETEKLARMMHIALGSGYEPGRETLYHCDIVLNNPRQKMNIWGTDLKGKEHWIIKNGKFVV